ncbi:trafficking protein particle complex subunit 14 isoform X2 [Myiozetetes cayanensis]|uniref:trafficking protein particle complex subunit 14 isoform X2 n=1 Tax=Myiozetetes cayanensis TaxID=478635 RepID=UPI00215FABC9|nr:trafficking protein particle complex subunit 14 isoform X2 [Myiozetetes cayanensis]
MESQCDYSMYFPAVPFPPRELLAGSGPGGGYRALPRRNHLYLGETVRFLLVLRCRPGNPAGNPAGNPTGNTAGNAGNTAGNSPPRPPWAQLASSLAALATVAPGGDPAGVPRDGHGDGEDAEPAVFRECRALLTHSKGPPGCPGAGMPVEDPIVATDEVIFPLTVSLDQLPPGTGKAKIVVTVWQRDAEPPELQEGGGYLGLLQGRAPAQVFRQHRGAFKAQVSTMLTVLPPPLVRCRQVTVSGKYLTVLKVLNGCSQEEISLWDVQILPNFNASYLPVMPDGSVLLVDDVCHHSGEVPVGAFCRVAGAGSGCPCALSALEEQNFLFQLQAPERPPEDAKEGLEVPLVAVVQWSTPKLPFTSSIYTHYRLSPHHPPVPQAAEHPPGAASLRDDGHGGVAGAGAASLHGHLHPAQRPAGLPGRAPRLDPRDGHGRQGSLHTRFPGLHRVPHPGMGQGSHSHVPDPNPISLIPIPSP